MLKRLNRERMEEVVKMNQEIGSSVFVFEGIKNDLFSPTKYSIASLSPDHIEFDTVNEIVNIKFELRQNGIAGYFRLHQEDYCLYCKYGQLSFMKSGDAFVMQFPKHLLKLKINEVKAHRRFIQRLYKAKNQKL